MVRLKSVDPRFLHCYLIKHKLRPRDLDLSPRHCIRNKEVSKRILETYRSFKNTSLSIEDFFDCQIVEFISSRIDQGFWSNCDEITREPFLLCYVKNGSGVGKDRYHHGVSREEMKLSKPIKITLEHLFSLYQINDVFESLDPDQIAMFEERFNVNLHFYHLDDHGLGKRSNDLPAPNDRGQSDIYIGLRNGDYFWTSKRLCESIYYCSKHPGKCTFMSDRTDHLTTHMATCRIDTTITAKQVSQMSH